jgi:hypothetical protein
MARSAVWWAGGSFRAVVEILRGSVLHRRHHHAVRGPVAAQLVADDNPWRNSLRSPRKNFLAAAALRRAWTRISNSPPKPEEPGRPTPRRPLTMTHPRARTAHTRPTTKGIQITQSTEPASTGPEKGPYPGVTRLLSRSRRLSGHSFERDDQSWCSPDQVVANLSCINHCAAGLLLSPPHLATDAAWW